MARMLFLSGKRAEDAFGGRLSTRIAPQLLPAADSPRLLDSHRVPDSVSLGPAAAATDPGSGGEPKRQPFDHRSQGRVLHLPSTRLGAGWVELDGKFSIRFRQRCKKTRPPARARAEACCCFRFLSHVQRKRGGVSGAGILGRAVAASRGKRRSVSFLQGETRVGLGAGSAEDLALDDAGAGPGP